MQHHPKNLINIDTDIEDNPQEEEYYDEEQDQDLEDTSKSNAQPKDNMVNSIELQPYFFVNLMNEVIPKENENEVEYIG